jgi:hypothetical protein
MASVLFATRNNNSNTVVDLAVPICELSPRHQDAPPRVLPLIDSYIAPSADVIALRSRLLAL